jgi:hypothetical protein
VVTRRWAPAALLLLAAAPPPSPASLELLLESARQPLPYLVLQPGAELAEVQIRGLPVDSVAVRAFAVVAPRGRLEECREAVAAPSAFTVSADAAQPLRQRFEPDALVESEPADEEGAGEVAAAEAAEPEEAEAPVAASSPSAAYRVALDDGWTLVVAPQVAVSSLWGRLVVSLRRGVERLFGSPSPTCELQIAVAPDDARRLQHLFRPGVRILVLQR